MNFEDIDIAASRHIFTALGSVNAVYSPAVGDDVTTDVIVDKDVEVFPGGFDSEVTERMTQISLQKSDITSAQRGETVIVGSITYLLKDLISDDGIEIVYTVIEQ